MAYVYLFLSLAGLSLFLAFLGFGVAYLLGAFH